MNLGRIAIVALSTFAPLIVVGETRAEPAWAFEGGNLSFGEPNTDIIWFGATCAERGVAQLLLSTRLPTTRAGEETTVRFTSKAGTDVRKTTIEFVEDDDEYISLKVPIEAKLFDLLKQDGEITIHIDGDSPTKLPVSGTSLLVDRFRRSCN